MNLLQLVFVVSGVIIFILALDISRRQKFNALHFLVFLGVGAGLLVFTFFPGILDMLGHIFGLPRGADVLVYVSIIFLMYFVLMLLARAEKNREDITRLVREMAMLRSKLDDYENK
ncbi:MAG: DUF2304 domain-containing protein [Patescibacteria group bacterium]